MNNYEKFKKRTRIRLETVVVIVLFLLVFTLLMIPRFHREATKTDEPVIIFIESVDIPQVKLQEIGAPKPQPVIPVLDEESDISLDSTLFIINFEDYEGEDNPPPPPPDGDDDPVIVFTPYDKAPVPIGGMAAIAQNVVYPEIARKAGLGGTVYVQSFIDDKGIVRDCVINKGLPGTGFDKAAVEAIKRTRWEPALQNDRPVGVWIAIPVTFKLNAK